MVGSVGVAGTAHAHFYLHQPPAWRSQSALGDPQKAAPCGDDGNAMATGVVTPFKAGETITIQLQETIAHPGHYRVALAVNDRSELPADPPVTPGSTPCGSTVIQNPPVFPVLADGELRHTTALSGMQTIRVKLPDNVTCTKCTLQIIEFMSNHALNNPGGCYYHHCADISISASTGTGGTGGTGTAGAAGTGGTTTGSGGTSGSAGAGASGGTSGGLGTGGGSLGTGGNAGASGNAGAGGNAGGVGGASGGGAAGTDAGTSGGASGMGTGAANPAGPATEDGSCTCSVPGQRREAHGFAGLALVLLGFASRRRNR